MRNVRQAFDKNIFFGLIKSGLMFLTKGAFPGDYKKLQSDAEKIKSRNDNSSGKQEIKALSKTEAVFLSGNKTRDDIPHALTS